MRYIVLLLVLLVGAGFVFINWPAVNAPRRSQSFDYYS